MYVLSRACQLSGGFAFFSWFKDQPGQDGAKAGDFVATLGGYHPEFVLPKHYPAVPRLQLQWQLNDRLAIKGNAYYALTAHALMAGGLLEAVWTDSDVHASFIASADFLLAWQPYHYEARVSVQMHADVTLHVFGTHQLSFDAGAGVHLWGPEFSGTAEVHLSVLGFDVSFNVEFGDQQALPCAVPWTSFRQAFLPADLVGTAVEAGLVRSVDGPDAAWVVDPLNCRIAVTSLVPVTENSPLKPAFDGRLGVSPMGVPAEQLTSQLNVTIYDENDNDVSDLFEFEPIRKAMPAAMWGKPEVSEAHGQRFVKPPAPNGERLIGDVLVGLTLRPKVPLREPEPLPARPNPPDALGVRLGGPALATADALAQAYRQPRSAATADLVRQSASLTAMATNSRIELRDYHRPPVPSGDYTLTIAQSISSEGAPRESKTLPPQPFSVQGERFSLSPQDVVAVHPPPVSLGDYSATLPHALLARSTLPWERSPDGVERGANVANLPPWLVLLLVREDEETYIVTDDAKQPNSTGVQTGTLKELKQKVAFTLERGEHESDPVAFIDVDRSFLELTLPACDRLHLLAHVRSVQQPQGRSEFAVLLCPRTPQPMARNTVHLVSLERCYAADDKLVPGIGDPPRVRLVCLKTWQFHCTDHPKQDFHDKLRALGRGGLALVDAGGAFPLRIGAVPLRHERADGTVALAWYAGRWPRPTSTTGSRSRSPSRRRPRRRSCATRRSAWTTSLTARRGNWGACSCSTTRPRVGRSTTGSARATGRHTPRRRQPVSSTCRCRRIRSIARSRATRSSSSRACAACRSITSCPTSACCRPNRSATLSSTGVG